jgi:cupin fold WbuC family metalloprotein
MGTEPGTYIRPHRHLAGDKWELFTILRGKVAVLVFDDDCVVSKRVELTAGGDTCVIEIPSSSFHAFASLQSGSIVMEVKKGPYMRPGEGDWMPGTPAEGEAGAVELEKWYRSARSGDKLA